MKTKLRTMLLAAAGVLGSVAVAQAQPAPDPAPAPAPVPAPAPAPVTPAAEPVGVAPAAMPAAPPPVAPAPVNWGGTPPPADTVKQEAPKKPNPFGFSRFTWSNSGSTKIFGVGAPYIGTEDEVYTMDFGLNIRYSFLNLPKDKAYVNASTGVEVELTTSDSTTKNHQPLLRDTSVSVGYSHVLFQSADKQTRTNVIISGGASLPTSSLSRYQGKFIGTSLTGGFIHQQKLAGSKADWFQSVLFFGTVNWGHTFSRGYTPTSTELAVTTRPRQVACDKEAGCLSDQSDQLSGYSLAHDTVRFGATYYLDIYKDVLSFGNAWEIAERYKYAFADTCLNLPSTSGCEPAGRLSDATTRGAVTTFDVSLSYAIPENLGRVDLGYVNSTNQIGEDGRRRSVFYSPDAQFYMNVVAYFDGLYDKAASKKEDPNAKQRVGALPRFRAN